MTQPLGTVGDRSAKPVPSLVLRELRLPHHFFIADDCHRFYPTMMEKPQQTGPSSKLHPAAIHLLSQLCRLNASPHKKITWNEDSKEEGEGGG